VPARDLARERLEEAATVAAELGCERELQAVDAILDQGCGADLQRRVHAESGMDGVLDYLIAETAALEPEATLPARANPG
jgi:gamma-glutamyl:cysteine ligase YbdK (ATP-grasp superfamily)